MKFETVRIHYMELLSHVLAIQCDVMTSPLY